MITENVVINSQYSWIDINRPVKADFNFLKREYKISPLLVQDCLRREHLPKYEKNSEGHFILLRSYFEIHLEGELTLESFTRSVGFFITPERIHTIHLKDIPLITRLERTCEADSPKELLVLLHNLIKGVILTYEESIIQLHQAYVEFEDDVLSNNVDQLSLGRVNEFQRKIFLLKSLLKKSQVALVQGKGIWAANPELLQDLREEIDQLFFRIDDIAHNFDHLFSLHLSINDRKVNEIMQVLTVFASILLPLTFIASFYGMKFTVIPGLNSTEGLVFAVFVMVSMSISTIYYFKKKNRFPSDRISVKSLGLGHFQT